MGISEERTVFIQSVKLFKWSLPRLDRAYKIKYKMQDKIIPPAIPAITFHSALLSISILQRERDNRTATWIQFLMNCDSVNEWMAISQKNNSRR